MTSIAPRREGSSTTTMLGCSMPAVELDRLVAHPGEGDDGGAGAFGPILGEGLEVLALAQGQFRHHLGGGHRSLAAAGVPADLCQAILSAALRCGVLYGHGDSSPKRVEIERNAHTSPLRPYAGRSISVGHAEGPRLPRTANHGGPQRRARGPGRVPANGRLLYTGAVPGLHYAGEEYRFSMV